MTGSTLWVIMTGSTLWVIMTGSTLCGDYDGFHPLKRALCGQLSRRQRPQLVERDARVLVWSAIARRGNCEPDDCGVLGASQHGRRPAGSAKLLACVLRPEGASDAPRVFFRPGGVSAVFGRIVDGHGVGDSRGVERRSKAGAVGVPGVDLRCRFCAGVKESGFEERVEDRVREWRAVLVRE